VAGPIIATAADHGGTFHVSYKGGAVIPRVSVILIFWGLNWPNNQPNCASQAVIIDAVARMLDGPHMSGLAQYGIGLGLELSHHSLNFDPASPLTPDAWHTQIWDMIDAGTFPEPDDPGGRNLYMFIPPPNVPFINPMVTGAHAPVHDAELVDLDYAWAGFITHDGKIDTITTNLSHEIIEACTDPEAQVDDGWTIDGLAHPNCEICDVCTNTVQKVNGVAVQGYWSNFDGACIVQTMFSLRRFLQMKGFDLSQNKSLLQLQPGVTDVLAFVKAG
jgi:hypothetical protein